jgi:hypothetical protein
MLSGRAVSAGTPRRCRAELSNDLLDEEGALLGRLIDFAFDTLGVQALDVRVTTAKGSRLIITVHLAAVRRSAPADLADEPRV